MSHPIIHIGQQEKVYIGEIDANGDPVLTEGGLESWPDGTAVNNATITAQVKDTSDTNVGSSVSLSYVATSSGHYSGTIPTATTLLLTAGTIYHVWVIGSAGEVYRKLVYKAGYADGKG